MFYVLTQLNPPLLPLRGGHCQASGPSMADTRLAGLMSVQVAVMWSRQLCRSEGPKNDVPARRRIGEYRPQRVLPLIVDYVQILGVIELERVAHF